jgi:hypothetical protein
MDGVLTGVGMERFGLEMEANPLLRSLMERFGVAPALFLAKGMVILMMVHMLRNLDYYKGWTGFCGLVMLNLFYTFKAVIPWIIIHYKS